MEFFWIRILLLGEDVFEIISRMFEYINFNFYSNYKGINNIFLLWSGFIVYIKVDDSDEYLVKKKILRDYSYIYMFLLIVFFIVVLIVEKIFYFKFFESSYVLIFFFWFESCVIVFFFRFWGRK